MVISTLPLTVFALPGVQEESGTEEQAEVYDVVVSCATVKKSDGSDATEQVEKGTILDISLDEEKAAGLTFDHFESTDGTIIPNKSFRLLVTKSIFIYPVFSDGSIVFGEWQVYKDSDNCEKPVIYSRTDTLNRVTEYKYEYFNDGHHMFSPYEYVDEDTCKMVCEHCGFESVEQHSWSDEEVLVEATHENEGLVAHTCNKCGKRVETVVPKRTEHTWDADCTEYGSYGNWEIIQQAHGTEYGIRRRHCLYCDAYEDYWYVDTDYSTFFKDKYVKYQQTYGGMLTNNERFYSFEDGSGNTVYIYGVQYRYSYSSGNDGGQTYIFMFVDDGNPENIKPIYLSKSRGENFREYVWAAYGYAYDLNGWIEAIDSPDFALEKDISGVTIGNLMGQRASLLVSYGDDWKNIFNSYKIKADQDPNSFLTSKDNPEFKKWFIEYDNMTSSQTSVYVGKDEQENYIYNRYGGFDNAVLFRRWVSGEGNNKLFDEITVDRNTGVVIAKYTGTTAYRTQNYVQYYRDVVSKDAYDALDEFAQQGHVCTDNILTELKDFCTEQARNSFTNLTLVPPTNPSNVRIIVNGSYTASPNWFSTNNNGNVIGVGTNLTLTYNGKTDGGYVFDRWEMYDFHAKKWVVIGLSTSITINTSAKPFTEAVVIKCVDHYQEPVGEKYTITVQDGYFMVRNSYDNHASGEQVTEGTLIQPYINWENVPEGKDFDSWQVFEGGVYTTPVYDTNYSSYIPVTKDITLVPKYVDATRYLEAYGENGSVKYNGDFYYGESFTVNSEITLTTEGNDGYEYFYGWFVLDYSDKTGEKKILVSTDATYTFTFTGQRLIARWGNTPEPLPDYHDIDIIGGFGYTYGSEGDSIFVTSIRIRVGGEIQLIEDPESDNGIDLWKLTGDFDNENHYEDECTAYSGGFGYFYMRDCQEMPVHLTITGNGAPKVVLTYTETSGKLGSDIATEVSVTKNPGFNHLEFTLSPGYKVTIVSLANGTLVSEFTQDGDKYIWNSEEDVTDTGVLFIITAKSSYAGSSYIGLNNVECHAKGDEKRLVSGLDIYFDSYNAYTVTWKNYDGTILEEDADVKEGTMPVYDGATPFREAGAGSTYTFKGWTPEVAEVSGNAVYTAVFELTTAKYTVTWKNSDGTVLETDTDVEGGTTPVYNGQTPIKAATAQYTYTFAGWDKTVVPVTGDVTYTATYTQTVNKYTVTWKNYDGTVLETDTGVAYGATPTYNGQTPEKAADAQYTYTFLGWDTTVSSVEGNVTYTAVFSSGLNSYTVTWKDYDGRVLETDTGVGYGTTPEYNGTAPSRSATAEYTYTFAGWTPTVSSVTGDVTYTAAYSSVKNTYTVTWKNYDGTVLETDTGVEYGTTPTYDGAEPGKASTDQYTYTFAGWNTEVGTVTGTTVYTATFTESLRKYVVTWINDDGTVLETDSAVEYGTVPTFDSTTPTKAPTAQYTYTFNGWDKTVESVSGDATYKATYTQSTNTYTVTWQNYDGSVLETDTGVEYGVTPTYNGQNPEKAGDAQYTYAFKGWTETVIPVSGNVTYTAAFSSTVNKYKIVWKNYDGTVLETDENIEYGKTPVYNGMTPTRATEGTTDYVFTGWSPAVSTVVGNVEYTAQYNGQANAFTVTWKNYDGTVLRTDVNVPKGTVPSYQAESMPERAADAEFTYRFSGWSPQVSELSSDMTYTATFTKTKRTYAVTWKNYDGTVLNTENYEYGTTPSFKGNPPQKVSETSLTRYDFTGWTPVVSTVTGDAVYTATFSEVPAGYTVKWVNWDGTVLETDSNVSSGTTPTYNSATPARETSARYSYVFAGWSPQLSEVTSDITYTAVFAATELEYTVTWKNYDGTVLHVQTGVTYGTTPDYNGTVMPSRPSDETHEYMFVGWTPSITTVKGDVTYTAKFQEKNISVVTETTETTETTEITETSETTETTEITKTTETTDITETTEQTETTEVTTEETTEATTTEDVVTVETTEETTTEEVTTAEETTEVVIEDGNRKIVISNVVISDELAQAGFTSQQDVEDKLREVVSTLENYSDENISIFDVQMFVSFDGGKTYVEMTLDNIPEEGITLTLSYPDGIDPDKFDFTVLHMLGEDSGDKKAGDVETITPTKTDKGLVIVVKSLSPFAITWKEAPAAQQASLTWLWVLLICLAAAGIAVAVVVVIRKKKA